MTRNLPPQRVLSTLNADGSRRVLHPKLSRGRFLRHRRVVAYALIALFVVLPRIRIAGRPAVMIDLITREVPGSFYEFITRLPMEEDGKTKLDLSFDSSNAQAIFKMTAGAAKEPAAAGKA